MGTLKIGSQWNPRVLAGAVKGNKPGYFHAGPATPGQGNNASAPNPGSQGLSHPNQSHKVKQVPRGRDLTTGEKC